MQEEDFSKRDNFESYEEARKYLKEELKKLNLKPPKYDCARIMEPRVNKYSCISIDSYYYSVPDSLVGEFVLTKVYPDKIICHYKQKKVAVNKLNNLANRTMESLWAEESMGINSVIMLPKDIMPLLIQMRPCIM